MTANLADQKSTTAAMNVIRSRFCNIVVEFLVNNVGVHYNLKVLNLFENILNMQGHDLVFSIDYFSHFLLTGKLLPHMEASWLLNKM